MERDGIVDVANRIIADAIQNSTGRCIIVVSGAPTQARQDIMQEIKKGHKIEQVINTDWWLLDYDERTHKMSAADILQVNKVKEDFIKLLNGESIIVQPFDEKGVDGTEVMLAETGTTMIIGAASLVVKEIVQNSSVRIFVEDSHYDRKDGFILELINNSKINANVTLNV